MMGKTVTRMFAIATIALVWTAGCDRRDDHAVKPGGSTTGNAPSVRPEQPGPASVPVATGPAATEVSGQPTAVPPATVPSSELSREGHRPSSAEPSTPLHERIAKDLVAASPLAGLDDVRARSAAIEKLSKIAELIDAPLENLGWGFFDAAKGYDPAAYSLMVCEPTVWTKTILSMFMFTGQRSIRHEGKFTVVELGAKFRAKLPREDYPYPIWHTPASWQAHARVEAILLVFDGEELIAAYGKSAMVAGTGEADPPKWDGRWTWSDGLDRAQPRGGGFGLALAEENPELGAVSAAYAALEPKLRSYNCLGCHWPDNSAKASRLVLLGYPAHAMAARGALVSLLRNADRKPEDPHANRADGIPSQAARDELLRLAEAFELAAEHALSYESARRAVDIDGPP